jgi:hypothetical protein
MKKLWLERRQLIVIAVVSHGGQDADANYDTESADNSDYCQHHTGISVRRQIAPDILGMGLEPYYFWAAY